MIGSSFFEGGGFPDPQESQDSRRLREYKEQIESIRDFIDYGVNWRLVNVGDIDGWDEELRTILQGIMRLRNAPSTKELLESGDAVKHYIQDARQCLCAAARLIDQPRGIAKVKDEDTKNQKLRDCSTSLSIALTYFHV
jgi:hypothetical protein